MLVAQRGYVEAVQLLVDRGASVDAVDSTADGGTALIWASAENQVDVIQVVLQP